MTDDHQADVGDPAPTRHSARSRHRWKWWRSRGEWGPWEQKEALRARITELRAILDAIECDAALAPERQGVADAYARRAAAELDEAYNVLAHDKHPVLRRAAHLAVAQSHVDAAMNLLVWLAPAHDVEAMLPQMIALVDEHIPERDPRHKQMAEIAHRVKRTKKLNDVERFFLAETVSLARRLLQKETLRVRSFVRIVKFVSLALTLLVALVVVCGAVWPKMVPICFAPEANSMYEVVCPTNSEAQRDKPNTRSIAAAARTADYLVIALVGVVAASIASAATLRRIRGTALPYDVPVALALLKLPTGALTATLGLLLMRGGFVPGLTALDSSAQIIAWAIIFGYSQQLFTKFVDRQGQAVLDAVKGPTDSEDATTKP